MENKKTQRVEEAISGKRVAVGRRHMAFRLFISVHCYLFLCFSLLAFAQSPEELIALVSGDELWTHIAVLEKNPVDGKPTYSRSTYRRELANRAAGYIADELRKSPQIDVEYDDFSGFRNVAGTLRGASASPRVYLIGAHYDSQASREPDWNPYFSSAPGADDNASGVAVLLEMARVLSTAAPYAHTIRFVAFDAGEIGMLGSRHDAARAAGNAEEIAGMFNLDMLGFNWSFARVQVVTDRPSLWFANYLWLASRWYELDLEVSRNLDPKLANSDHKSFWDVGYRAVMLTENGESWMNTARYAANPYFHTYQDTSETVNVDLVRKIAQLMIAVVAELADQEGKRSLPDIYLYPPAQNTQNPVTIHGKFVSQFPLHIVIQPGDVEATLDRAAGKFSASVQLVGGINTVSATAISPAGVRSTVMEVKFLPEFRFRDAIVFPNPGRELVQFWCTGERPMDAMRVLVYRPDGTLVRTIKGVPEKSDKKIWRTWWNLKSAGVPIANGLYPCLFEVTVDGETYRTEVTLAVER